MQKKIIGTLCLIEVIIEKTFILYRYAVLIYIFPLGWNQKSTGNPKLC